MIDIVFNNFTTDKKFGKDFFDNVIEKTANETGLGSKKIELSINMVGEGRIKALNKKYRSKNKVTDVLSFPLHNKVNAKSVESGIISLGDIFICLPVAKKYAVRDGAALDFKLAFLAIHGFLHLLGYDHEKSTEEKNKIFGLQTRILTKLGF